MDWLAALVPSRLAPLIAILWLLVPTVYVCQAVAGLWRRMRLLRDPVPVTAEVTEVRAGGEVMEITDVSIVDVTLAYDADGRTWSHRQTRTDHQKVAYRVGSPVDLIYQRGNPANVIDADRHPWNDVIGPMVFSALLFVFMGWLLLFVGGLV